MALSPAVRTDHRSCGWLDWRLHRLSNLRPTKAQLPSQLGARANIELIYQRNPCAHPTHQQAAHRLQTNNTWLPRPTTPGYNTRRSARPVGRIHISLQYLLLHLQTASKRVAATTTMRQLTGPALELASSLGGETRRVPWRKRTRRSIASSLAKTPRLR